MHVVIFIAYVILAIWAFQAVVLVIGILGRLISRDIPLPRSPAQEHYFAYEAKKDRAARSARPLSERPSIIIFGTISTLAALVALAILLGN